MGMGKKLIFGFVLIIVLNYFMDYIVSNIDVSVKLFLWDLSGIVRALIITILNFVAFMGLRGLSGLGVPTAT